MNFVLFKKNMKNQAKETAKELFDMHLKILNSHFKKEAKEHAKITVDVLKNTDWYIPNKDEWNKYQDFLDEVKK